MPFFVKKHSFLTPIFEPLYILKSCLIFDELALPIFSKYNGFHREYLFLAKNFNLKIPQPN